MTLMPVRRSNVRALYIGCSTIALLAPAMAAAACSPNPTQAGTTTVCDGVETAGLSVATTGAVVSIGTSATVAAPAGVAAITVTASPPPASYATLAATLNIDGRVDGGTASGILVTPGAPAPSSYYVYYTETAVNVGPAGIVRGKNGIEIAPNSQSIYTSGRVTLTNNGTIAGTSGVALLGSDPTISSFAIVNTATGTIGAINTAVGSLDNAGLIDGGSLSAVATPSTPYYYSNYTAIKNSGAIRSGSVAATIALRDNYSYPSVSNSGTVVNTGTGAAIASTGSIGLVNGAGAVVRSAGASAVDAATTANVTNDGTISATRTAVNAPGGLNLTNRGTIVGDILGGANGGSSSIDTSGGGTISGNVRLGGGDDTLIVDYSAGAALTGISGSVDAGGGSNTLRLVIGSATTLAAPVVLPVTFQDVTYALADKATLTLAPGFTQGTTLLIGGSGTYSNTGTLINNTSLSTVGPAIGQRYPDFGTLTVINNGSISAKLAKPYDAAIALSFGYGAVINSGSITAAGGRGLNLGIDALTNSGSIVADGDAVTGFNTVLVNTGSIVSTGGIGFVGSGSQTIETNSGTIRGATVGAQVGNIKLINTGRIASPKVGVALDSAAILDNRPGGIIDGGVGPASPYGSNYTYQVKVINAGTINGNVNFGSSPYVSSYGSNNVFVASPGGIVNGNLFLGTGNDVFVTNLANTGPGAFAGVTGTVSGTGAESIRYLTDTGTTAAVVAAAGIFTRVGFELTKGASLTLNAPAAQILGLEFAGAGTVDLTADLAQTDATVINLLAQSALVSAYPPVPNAVVLTSHGTLTATSTLAAGFGAQPAVMLAAGSSFTNAGTIVLRSAGAPLVGISGAGTVTNSGTITLDGATAIGGTSYAIGELSVINSGTIVQAPGAAASTGIAGAATITNSGSISVAGAAVSTGSYYGPSTITNSGTLRSTGGAAISGGLYGSSAATVINVAGGSIIGVGQAITLQGGGSVDNSGVITGDVVLGCMTSFCYGNSTSTYVARTGSTLAGNLTFGGGDDIFVSLDGTTGVTGTINGGGGVNTYARAYAASSTIVAGSGLPTGFQRQGIGASGAATVITVAGPPSGLDQGLFFFGDGQIVNQVNVNAGDPRGAANTVNLGGPYGVPGVGSTLAFANQARLSDGVNGSARSFTNSGTVTSSSGQVAVGLAVPESRFDFANSGSITATTSCVTYDSTVYCSGQPAVTLRNGVYPSTNGKVTFANSGTLTGGAEIILAATDFAFDNSGKITGVPGASANANFIALDGSAGFNGVTATINNSGTIANGLYVDAASRRLSVTSSGTIGSSYGQGLAAFQLARQIVDATGNLTTVADQDSATLTNSGMISGTVQLSSRATATSLTNSGTVTLTDRQVPPGSVAVAVGAGTLSSQSIAVVNSGSIVDAAANGAALAVAGYAARYNGPGPTLVPLADGATATIAVSNSGTLRADGGGRVALGTTDYPVDNLAPAIALSAVAISDGASRVTIDNAVGGVISAAGAPSSDTGPGPVSGFAGGGSVAVFASGTMVAITNAGTITGGAGTTIGAGAAVALPTTLADLGGYLAGAIATVGSVDTVKNAKTGVIAGSIDLGAFDDRIENYGTITGNVFLRDGNDTFVQSLGGTLIGTADGGAGNNTLILDATGGGTLSQALLDRFVNFAAPTLQGTGVITVAGPLRLPTLTVTSGALTIAAGSTLATTGPVAITGGDADVAITNLGTVSGGIVLGGGTDRVDNRGTVTGAVTFGDGAATVTNSGTIGGPVTGGNGVISFTNSGRVDRIALGGGNDAVVNSGTIDGGITFGDGVDALTNSGTIAGPVRFGSGAITVVNSGSITGTLTFGSGPTALTTSGPIASPIVFGSGDDTLTLQHGGRVVVVDGGRGNSTLVLALGGSDAQPDEVTLTGITGFGRTRVTSGVTALSGTYATGAVEVAAGRLIGRAGSVLTAPSITVAPGAVFGSAGKVVGNVTVGGTLSPGASPGVMTVTGNVALAAGSTTLFELTPAVSDQLLVSGTLTIATGTTLALTGARPLTPGTPFDLIVADGGITGSFTTVSQAATVLGFVRQSATRLQLFGQFAVDAGFAPGVLRSVNYVNTVLTGGTANAALIAAVPSLLTPAGATNTAAFALLTPEAYASASRIGTENGLTLAQALRTTADQGPSRPGLNTFVQGIGAWRQLASDSSASRADVNSGGVIGGIGFARGSVALSVFGGYLDSRQSIGQLGSRTVATGAVAGVSGTVSSSAFGAVVTLAYDGSDARTTRTVPGATAIGNYSLHGFVADARVTYALPLGGVRLSPEGGVTHVATMRGTAAEVGSAAFGLAVTQRTDSADFVDGAVRIAADHPAAFAPWASAGVRHQFGGRDRLAAASFGGGVASLIAPGVGATATLASVAAGFNWRLSTPLALYGAYRGEFAPRETGHSATVGARFAF